RRLGDFDRDRMVAQADSAGDEHGKLADLVVVLNDVDDLAANVVGRRFEGSDLGTGSVSDINKRAPHQAATMEEELSLEKGVLHESVDDEVETHARAPAKDGALAKDDGTKVVAGHRLELDLAEALGFRVRAAGVDRRLFVIGGAVGQAIVERATR